MNYGDSLIDDSPTNNNCDVFPSKGKYSIPHLTENGYELIIQEKKQRHTNIVNGVKYMISNENDIIQNVLIKGLQWNNEMFHYH